MTSQKSLEGKTAIVTGGAGGLGTAFSLALANAGANVGVAFIGNPAPAQALVQQIQALSVKSITLEADITDPAAVKAMFTKADSKLGLLDILVNNAGIDGIRVRAWEVDAVKWRKTFEVNLFGSFHCA